MGNGKLKHKFDCLLCFKYENNPTWLGKIFGHCCIYRNIGKGMSIKIDPTFDGTMIIPYKLEIQDYLPALQLEYNGYVLDIDVGKWKTNILLFGSCVGIIKNMLGIRAWWVITPKQLERYIIRRESGRVG